MDKFEEQTLKIWDELVEMAAAPDFEDSKMTYGAFVKEHNLGLARDIGHKLEPIFYFCRCNNTPILTDLLHSAETKTPSNRPNVDSERYAELVRGVRRFFWAERYRDLLKSFISVPE